MDLTLVVVEQKVTVAVGLVLVALLDMFDEERVDCHLVRDQVEVLDQVDQDHHLDLGLGSLRHLQNFGPKVFLFSVLHFVPSGPDDEAGAK